MPVERSASLLACHCRVETCAHRWMPHAGLRVVHSYTCDFLQRVWAWRHLRLEGFLVVPESCVEIRHAILAKFHKPFFSNFSVVAKGLGFEAFAAGRFSCRKCQSPPSKFDTRSLQSFRSHFFRTFLLLQRVWALRHVRLEGFLVGSARVLRRNSTRDPCKVS